MATTLVLKNAYVSLDSTDLSSYVKQVTLRGEADKVDDVAMGDDVHHNVKGLFNWSVELQFKQSFTAAELDSILWPFFIGSDAKALIVKPNGGTTSTNNPKWTGNAHLFDYPPISGSVGEGALTSITLEPGDGTMLARATSD